MNTYERKAVISVEDFVKLPCKAKCEVLGEQIKTNTRRIRCFVRSQVCSCCGLEGSFFALERHTHEGASEGYHANLYGIKNGKEILFTRDHTIPKSRGGADTLANSTTMCGPCNWSKSSKLPSETRIVKSKAGKLFPLPVSGRTLKDFKIIFMTSEENSMEIHNNSEEIRIKCKDRKKFGIILDMCEDLCKKNLGSIDMIYKGSLIFSDNSISFSLVNEKYKDTIEFFYETRFTKASKPGILALLKGYFDNFFKKETLA